MAAGVATIVAQRDRLRQIDRERLVAQIREAMPGGRAEGDEPDTVGEATDPGPGTADADTAEVEENGASVADGGDTVESTSAP